MTEPTFISPPGLCGAPYEYASVAAAGSLMFTAGACPLDADGVVVGIGDPETQAAVALANLLITLAAAGAGPQHLLRTTIFVDGDRSTMVRVWNVISVGLAPHRPPSTLLGVAALGYPDQLVEIDGIALLPNAGDEADG